MQIYCAYPLIRCDISLFPTLAYGTPWLVMHVSTSLVGVLCADPRVPHLRAKTRVHHASPSVQLCFCLASRRLLLLILTISSSVCSSIITAGRQRIYSIPSLVAFSDRTLVAFSLYSCVRSELDPLVAQQQRTRRLRSSVAKFWRNLIALALEVKATCFFSLDVGAFPLYFVSGPGSVFVLRKYGHRSGTREFPQSFGGTSSSLDSDTGFWIR